MPTLSEYTEDMNSEGFVGLLKDKSTEEIEEEVRSGIVLIGQSSNSIINAIMVGGVFFNKADDALKMLSFLQSKDVRINNLFPSDFAMNSCFTSAVQNLGGDKPCLLSRQVCQFFVDSGYDVDAFKTNNRKELAETLNSLQRPQETDRATPLKRR